MNRALIAAVVLALSGCQGLDRLINGAEGPTQPDPEVINSQPPIGEAPEFNVPTPIGFSRVVFHGRLSGNNVVTIQNVSGSLVRVFVKDAAGWFIIGTNGVGPYGYQRPSTDQIQYTGQWVGGKEYCIYQYIPD